MRRLLCLSLLIAVLSTACGPVGDGPGTPAATRTSLPRVLPPTHSPEPSPTAGASATPWPTLAPTPTVDPAQDSQQAAALRGEFAADLDLFPAATRYWIELSVDFDPAESDARLNGQARIRYTNTERVPLAELVLMLWPNTEQYLAEMTAGPALIDGTLVTPEVEADGLRLRLRLPQPLGSGDSLDLSIPFQLRVSGPIRAGSPRRFGVTDGVLLAPTFYPLVPPIRDGEWVAEPAPPLGDTTTSDIAFYRLQVDAPGELAVVASGVELERTSAGGRQQVTFASGPVRDLALTVGRLEEHLGRAGQIALRAWVLPEHAGEVRTLLNAAALQLNTLSELLGPYPYPELDLVDAPGAYGGIEYPGLVFIGTLESGWVVIPTVHEVAHQWFYGLIGSDQLAEPWLDEAAATYAEVLYYENSVDPGRATWLLSDFRARVRSHPNPEMPIGLPVAAYPTGEDYGLFVYLKGALFFQELRQTMGERAFVDFLAAYGQAYRYRNATSAGFQALAEETCTCDLDPLFDLWVYEGGPLPVP